MALLLIGIAVIEGGAVLLSGMAAHDVSVAVAGAVVLTGAGIGLLIVNRKSSI